MNLRPSGARRVFDLACKAKDPVNLSIGEPDFDIPDPYFVLYGRQVLLLGGRPVSCDMNRIINKGYRRGREVRFYLRPFYDKGKSPWKSHRKQVKSEPS